MKKPRFPPALKLGQHVRLTPDGTCREVWHVGPGWAEVRPIYSRPRLVEIPGKPPFYATKGAPEAPISVHSFVYPCNCQEEEEE